MKALEENIEGKFCDIGFCSDFLDITSKTQATKEKDKQTLSKFKTSVYQRTQHKEKAIH